MTRSLKVVVEQAAARVIAGARVGVVAAVVPEAKVERDGDGGGGAAEGSEVVPARSATVAGVERGNVTKRESVRAHAQAAQQARTLHAHHPSPKVMLQ